MELAGCGRTEIARPVIANNEHTSRFPCLRRQRQLVELGRQQPASATACSDRLWSQIRETRNWRVVGSGVFICRPILWFNVTLTRPERLPRSLILQECPIVAEYSIPQSGSGAWVRRRMALLERAQQLFELLCGGRRKIAVQFGLRSKQHDVAAFQTISSCVLSSRRRSIRCRILQ